VYSTKKKIWKPPILAYIESGWGGKVSVLEGDITGHSDEKVHMDMCSIPYGYRDRYVCPVSWPPRSPDLTPSDICWLVVDTSGEFLARMLDAVTRIKGGDDQHRRTTRNLRTRAAKCTEVDGWIFELLLCTVINLSFLCNKICHLNITWKLRVKLNSAWFPFFVRVHNAILLKDPNSIVSITIQKYRHVHINVYLTKIDIITSKNIDPSSWITLYKLRKSTLIK